MKFLTAILMPLLLIVGTIGCSGNKTPDSNGVGATAGESSTPESSKGAARSESGQDGQKVLVVFFSPTGTTKGVAEKIAAVENAELYEIKAAQEYSTADLDWNDPKSRSTLEQNDKKARPKIGSAPLSLEGYAKIYIGYPIWWGEEPRIMDTFVESYKFDGITMIPFCTSVSSGVGRSGQNLAEHADGGDWRDGQRFDNRASDASVQTWIDGLK